MNIHVSDEYQIKKTWKKGQFFLTAEFQSIHTDGAMETELHLSNTNNHSSGKNLSYLSKCIKMIRNGVYTYSHSTAQPDTEQLQRQL